MKCSRNLVISLRIYLKSIHDFEFYIIHQVMGVLRIHIIRFFEKCCSTSINEYNFKVYPCLWPHVFPGVRLLVLLGVETLCYHMQILSCRLLWKAECILLSKFNETKRHQTYYFCMCHVSWHSGTISCINYLYTVGYWSQYFRRHHKHLPHPQQRKAFIQQDRFQKWCYFLYKDASVYLQLLNIYGGSDTT
jgi:hypothetical protein